MKNLYEVLGIPNYSTIDEVIQAYDRHKHLFLEIQKPTDEEQAKFDQQSAAFFTLSLESTKVDYDSQLSAVYSSTPQIKTQVERTVKPKSNKALFPLLLGAAALCSGYYYFSEHNKNSDNLNEPQVAAIKEPTQPLEQLKDQGFVEPFLLDFEKAGASLRSAVLYNGLLGGEIRNTTPYPASAFLEPITATAANQSFPSYSGIIPDTPTYNFGDIKLLLENPTEESAYVKIIYLDEGENYVIREVFLQPHSKFTVSGLPEGAIQLATMFPNYPRFSFISYQADIYPEMINTIPLYGKKVLSNTVF